MRETLVTLGVPRSTYYRWKKSNGRQPDRASGADPLTPEEKEKIEAVKAVHPHLRHRQIQGGAYRQKGAIFPSSAIYRYLKGRDLVERYERRPAPWETPRYEIWQKNLMWGCDWTELRIGDLLKK